MAVLRGFAIWRRRRGPRVPHEPGSSHHVSRRRILICGEIAFMNATVQRLRVFRETLGAHLPGYVRNILSVLGEMELSIHREEVLKRLTNPNTQPDLNDRPA